MFPAFVKWGPYGALLVLFIIAAVFRPVLPIDETRYLTVAWEMFLHKQYAVLTLNFSPYHHKPPLLFWLINVCWEILGVHRWTALVPVLAASSAVLYLTQRLSKQLFFYDKKSADIIPWLMIGAMPFLLYGTLVMFDMLITAIILAVLVVCICYAQAPKFYYVILLGLFMGIGVLAKGPVVYLYLVWPLVLYFIWRDTEWLRPPRFYKGMMLSWLISLLPVAAWILPVILTSDRDFTYWLLWEQTAGRITGGFNAAHVRPFYFYIPLIPLLFFPWILFPQVWKKIPRINIHDRGMRFVVICTLPVLVSFSLIAGKQPHYLLPLLPIIIIGFHHVINAIPKRAVILSALSMVLLVAGGQVVTAPFITPYYDLNPIVSYVRKHQSADWAFVNNYQGELGYLARLEKPMENLSLGELDTWFTQHPEGYAVVKYKDLAAMRNYRLLVTQRYRGRNLGIFVR